MHLEQGRKWHVRLDIISIIYATQKERRDLLYTQRTRRIMTERLLTKRHRSHTDTRDTLLKREHSLINDILSTSHSFPYSKSGQTAPICDTHFLHDSVLVRLDRKI